MKAAVVILMAGMLAPVAVFAQEWTGYTYPDPGFAIQFPAVPAVESGTVKNSTGVSLPLRRYAVRQDGISYVLTVVNYSSTNADALTTISETERSIRASGKVTAATGARVNGAIGRRLSVDGADGSRSAIAIFFVDRHLYTLVGRAAAPNANERSEDAIRFQQSLHFLTDDSIFGGFFGGNSNSNSNSNEQQQWQQRHQLQQHRGRQQYHHHHWHHWQQHRRHRHRHRHRRWCGSRQSHCQFARRRRLHGQVARRCCATGNSGWTGARYLHSGRPAELTAQSGFRALTAPPIGRPGQERLPDSMGIGWQLSRLGRKRGRLDAWQPGCNFGASPVFLRIRGRARRRYR